MKRLIVPAFPPLKTSHRQLRLPFGIDHEEIHFFVKCPDCMKTVELRLVADGPFGIILELLNTGPGRWAAG